MTAEMYIKAQLAARVHREAAHHGGIANMLAVAFVNRNRVLAGWHGGNWMQVIGHGDEYAGTLYPPLVPDLRDLQFRTLLAQIDDIYSGHAVDHMTEGALFYCELNNINRPWFRENVLSDLVNHAHVATVGNVSFFR